MSNTAAIGKISKRISRHAKRVRECGFIDGCGVRHEPWSDEEYIRRLAAPMRSRPVFSFRIRKPS